MRPDMEGRMKSLSCDKPITAWFHARGCSETRNEPNRKRLVSRSPIGGKVEVHTFISLPRIYKMEYSVLLWLRLKKAD